MDSELWDNAGASQEERIRAYGSTGSNLSPGPKIRDNEDLDIQLHDFKGAHLKEPLLLPETSTVVISGDKKAAIRPTSLHSLLSSHSGSQRSNYSETSFHQHASWIKHPKVRENWKIVAASAFLSLLGIALILTGLGIAVTPSRGYHCLIFGIIGFLCVVPGGYHFVYIYCAAIGKPGYQFENLPVLR
ncbi:transmembrane protein 134 [Biomphalaria glabrata]|uniref:Transmembrane protein 134-like n=1 Tax=Biomphalaria glabrata TaxID=6526 RepID=A0A2C9LUT8_BIOGL|nr:transmembrane protein 134-like [Biomphalaria glabrata]XP_055863074.1 transmembrane protein 134-like [Biomphalaria glabrata]KAI8749135.1 transmembrane protein 134 [Biomphalaria glabrata]KAI8753684.1 transmembrane protein 134-like [Biomphalaria glabrata]